MEFKRKNFIFERFFNVISAYVPTSNDAITWYDGSNTRSTDGSNGAKAHIDATSTITKCSTTTHDEPNGTTTGMGYFGI